MKRNSLSQFYIAGLMFFISLTPFLSLAQNCTNSAVRTGSFIINMGVTPQTLNNGLKPYGMIQDLINNYRVPIIWSINPGKAKDGIDFTHNGVNYRGGTFIVPAQFRNATVNNRINYWTGQGVVGATSVAPLNVPIYDTLTSFPKIMIDISSGREDIIINYYNNAGIYSLPALVDTAATGNTGVNPARSFSVNLGRRPATGNTIIAVISTRGAVASRVGSIVQSGASWARARQSTNTGGVTTEIWYTTSIPIGTDSIISINLADSLRAAAIVMEYSGLLKPNALNNQGNNNQNTSTNASTNPANANARGLVIGGIGYVNSSINLSSITNSFTPLAIAASTNSTNSLNPKVYALERVVDVTAAYGTGGVLSASTQWTGAVATFNAETANSAYQLGIPQNLSGCNDIWTNPHDDPTWASHGYLHNFVTVNKGHIWAQCHEVSMMESCRESVAPFRQLNFLSTTGLECYKAGDCNGISTVHAKDPTLPAFHHFPTHPVMQFMGPMTNATDNGSEKWYKPVNAWNSTTFRGVTTSDGSSPGEGALLAFGRAFGNPNNGLVMYTGGHDMAKHPNPDNIAAQRSYFNFILFTGMESAVKANYNIPTAVTANKSYPITATASGGVGPYSYEWSSLMGGTFSPQGTGNTVYNAPNVPTDTTDEIRIKITDACGRVSTQIACVRLVVNSQLPVELLHFTATAKKNEVRTSWATASEVDNDFFTVERSRDGINFETIGTVDGAGTSHSINTYSFPDKSPNYGLSYYRLRQTDFDGAYTYSNIVPVQLNTGKFSIFPNPATTSAVVLFEDLDGEPVILRIFDILGRTVLEQPLRIDGQSQRTTDLDLAGLPKGIYQVECTGSGFVEKVQLVIQ